METLIPRFFNPPQQSYFLFGPRGTGKSTFQKYVYPEALWIDLLQPDVYRNYSAQPERIIDLVHGNQQKTTIIVKVQKVPPLLDAVHYLIEENKNKQFILTGSSARKLKRSNMDLLAGRVLLRTMHPFSMSELQKNLADALRFGLLPVVHDAPSPAETLSAYVDLYIREEIQQEGLTRNIGNFNRFLQACSFSHAGLLNVSNIARECRVERKVVESYLTILEDILLAFKLDVFNKRAQRALVTHPKFYFFDAGVFRNLRPTGPLDSPHEIDSAALEGLVAQHLRAWNAYIGAKYTLHFWKTRSGLEVDFILYGEREIYAMEVKNSQTIRPMDLRGLKAFREDYPNCTPLLLYRGQEKLLIQDIYCIPVETFLRELHPNDSTLPL